MKVQKTRILILVEDKYPEIDYVKVITRDLINCKVDIISIPFFLSFIAHQKYDVVVIPFAPSFDTPLYKLIKILLKINIVVICLNLDQNKLPFENQYRKIALTEFSLYGMLPCSWSTNYTKFLQECGFGLEIIKCQNFYNSILNTTRNKIQKNENSIIFIMDFKWASVDNNFIQFKIKAGCDENIIDSVKKFSNMYVIEFFKQIINFAQSNFNYEIIIFIDLLVDLDNFLIKYGVKDFRIPSNISFKGGKNYKRYIKNNLLFTNWDPVSLAKSELDGRVLCFMPFNAPEWFQSSVYNKIVKIKDFSNLIIFDDKFFEKAAKDLNYGNYSNNIDITLLLDQYSFKKNKNIFLLAKLYFLRFEFFIYNCKNIFKSLITFLINKSTKNMNENYFWPFSIKF